MINFTFRTLYKGRPKDLIIPRTDSITHTPPKSPITDKSASQQQLQTQVQQSQQLQQQQQQQQVQQQEQEQSQGIINKIRNKSPRPSSSNSSQFTSVSPTQPNFPITFTAEEVSSVDNDSINKNGDNRRLHGSNLSNSSFSSQKKSIFTRDNKHAPKDDRMEKLLKKAKNFLDNKQRPKARITSLWSFIGKHIFYFYIICTNYLTITFI
jgi:hypothetical protein